MSHSNHQLYHFDSDQLYHFDSDQLYHSDDELYDSGDELYHSDSDDLLYDDYDLLLLLLLLRMLLIECFDFSSKNVKIPKVEDLQAKIDEMQNEIDKLTKENESLEMFDAVSEDLDFVHVEKLQKMLPTLKRITNSYIEESQKFKAIQDAKNGKIIDLDHDQIVKMHEIAKQIEKLHNSLEAFKQSCNQVESILKNKNY